MATADTVSSDAPRRVKIAGMDCGSCAATIENSIRQLPGVNHAHVSFTTEILEVGGNVSLSRIEDRLSELGYRIADEAQAAAVKLDRHGLGGFAGFLWDQPPLRRVLLVAAVTLVGLPALFNAPAFAGVGALDWLFGAGVVTAGTPVFIKGLRALVYGRRVTIDLLMAVACAGALAIGATGEAITVILLFILGEALEAYSAERARDSVRSLMTLQPQEATVLRGHADESHTDHGGECDGHADHGDHHHDHGHDHQLTVPIEQVNVGERVLVRPAQRIPVDGEIIEGISSVNEAPVTGESVPAAKRPGDLVMAGTVNGEAALQVRVTRPATDGTIARIARLVQEAQAQRSPAERFIDRFARWYTPAVVMIAVLVTVVPVAFFGQPLLDTADGTRGWLYRGLALLIIACPCALVISIPVTVVSGLTRLAQLGVLVKGGAQLDRLADIRTIAFDKTGTLTYGKPQVTTVMGTDCAHAASSEKECDDCDDLVAAAASVERLSEHPVAHAILSAAGKRGLAHRWPTARHVQAHPGRGVSGELKDGSSIAVGNADMFAEQIRTASAPGLGAVNDGETVMYVAQNNRLVGYIGVQDEARRDTQATLAELGSFDPPVRRVMLTGDNPVAAQRVADRIGNIDELRAGLLPDEKLNAIEQLSHTGATAMVGDGINDAPALARADVGIAMGGGGTAQAMETADVVLMRDDLAQVPAALRIARKSRRIIKENIVLSLALKLAFLGLAIPGLATLWMAVLADVGATLLVTLNGMRLLREA